MKIAIVHDWLTGMRGGEKVLEAMIELLAEKGSADLYTLFHVKGSVSKIIEKQKITTSFLQKFPLLSTHYRYYLPLFPKAIESLNIKKYDLLITSSHCVAKGITKESGIPHICYCYTPMRYLWIKTDDYFQKKKNPISHIAFSGISSYLKRWDLASNKKVDRFIAISHAVSGRIQHYYQRTADIIYPPVETDQFFISKEIKNYYLIVSALVPYKKIDLAIHAFNKLGYPLAIVGDGPEKDYLRKIAKKNIVFLGWQSQDHLARLFSQCKAFIFPGEEDFGIAPVEAMASGRPVIAYARGGALETVTEETGIFFKEQTVDSLIESLLLFEKGKTWFHPEKIRGHALRFDKEIFKEKFRDYVEKHISY